MSLGRSLQFFRKMKQMTQEELSEKLTLWIILWSYVMIGLSDWMKVILSHYVIGIITQKQAQNAVNALP